MKSKIYKGVDIHLEFGDEWQKIINILDKAIEKNDKLTLEEAVYTFTNMANILINNHNVHKNNVDKLLLDTLEWCSNEW